MSRKTELLIIGGTVLAIASAVSHFVTRTFKFRTEALTPLTFGGTNLPINAMAAGSSLTFFGIEWSEMSKALGVRIRAWTTPGGSVLESEFLQRTAPQVGITLLGVSANDLNDNYISEFHADAVPLLETVSSLREARVNWPYARRVLSQYPLNYLHVLFPTAGRSAHVMVGIRDQLRSLRRRAAPEASERAVVSDSNPHQDSIETWEAARRRRQLGDMRAAASSSFEFHGPKRDALFRFLRRGAAQGKMIVVVIPESPLFRQEFITADVQRRFEVLLAEARERTPEAVWVRLDTVPELLQSNKYYWDLVHMNAAGQALATQVLLTQLAAAGVVK